MYYMRFHNDDGSSEEFEVHQGHIYCRVSSSSSSQLHSLADQASGLTRYVYRQSLLLYQ